MKSQTVFVVFVVPLVLLFLFRLLCPVLPFPSDPSASVKGQRIMVTGASQGIGASLVEEYAKRGASSISIVARSKSGLESVAAAVKSKYPATTIVVLPADLSKKDSCEAVVAEARAAMGGIDTLVLNHITSARFGLWLPDEVSSSPSGVVRDDDPTFLPDLFAVNTFSYIWLSTAAMPHLSSSPFVGSLGVVSSFAALTGAPKVAAYSSSKHALHGFFNSLRMELKLAGISVSVTLCVIGATDTEGSRYTQKQMAKEVVWDSPAWAAESIVRGVGGKRREIYHPHHLLAPARLMYVFFPDLLERILLKTVVQ